LKVFLLTDIPSPYQVEILNEIARDKDVDLHVAYLRDKDPGRSWSGVTIEHEYSVLNTGANRISKARDLLKNSDFAVFNFYLHPHAQTLIDERAGSRKPWCFWGERLGLRKPEWVGRIARLWKLRWLHQSYAPIWGIGNFAVDRYRSEFGSSHSYFNFPYFSQLDRFKVARHGRRCDSETVFLFSGSLIPRKGVDLMARAFVRLRNEGRDVKLKILGDGPLMPRLRDTLSSVRESVEILGFSDWNDLPARYASSDVLCVPSRYDGWGLVVPEGLASGLPVIATDRMGAALEFVETGTNGWLIHANSENAILDAMRAAALASHSVLNNLSQAAITSVQAHTLAQGAARFKSYVCEGIQGWH
jgi:glycosyltransferase involved in cell wall biosynthesis